MRSVLSRFCLGLHAKWIADVAPRVATGITIKNLLIVSGEVDTDLIMLSNHGCKVAADNQGLAPPLRFSQKNEDTLISIEAIDPLKTFFRKIELMQCRVFDIKSIQVGDQTLKACMMLPLQQVPLQRFIVIPFIPLANLR